MLASSWFTTWLVLVLASSRFTRGLCLCLRRPGSHVAYACVVPVHTWLMLVLASSRFTRGLCLCLRRPRSHVAYACACVVPVHTWLVLMLVSSRFTRGLCLRRTCNCTVSYCTVPVSVPTFTVKCPRKEPVQPRPNVITGEDFDCMTTASLSPKATHKQENKRANKILLMVTQSTIWAIRKVSWGPANLSKECDACKASTKWVGGGEGVGGRERERG